MKSALIIIAMVISVSSMAAEKKKESKKNWSSDLRTKIGTDYKGFTRI